MKNTFLSLLIICLAGFAEKCVAQGMYLFLEETETFVDVTPHDIQRQAAKNSFKSVTLVGGVLKPGIYFYTNNAIPIPKLLSFAGEIKEGNLVIAPDQVIVMHKMRMIKTFSVEKFIVGVTHELTDGEVLYRRTRMGL